jgi:hypothetical protein
MAEFVGSEPADRFDVFAAILDMRPAWHARAACRGEHPVMFPRKGRGTKNLSPYAAALALCSNCLVRTSCAAAGKDEHNGVWGGQIKDKRMERPQSVATVMRNYQPWTTQQLEAATGRHTSEVKRQLSTLIKSGLVTVDLDDNNHNTYTMKGTTNGRWE